MNCPNCNTAGINVSKITRLVYCYECTKCKRYATAKGKDQAVKDFLEKPNYTGDKNV